MIKPKYYQFSEKIAKVPVHLPFLLAIVCLLGITILYSAAGASFSPWAVRQLLVFSCSIPVILLLIIMRTRFYYNFAYVLYGLALIFLALVLIVGKKVMGATRWLDFGFVSLQPSELAKISVVLFLARFLHDKQHVDASFWHVIVPAIFACVIPFLLILKQPDLGTAMIIIIVMITMLFAYGIDVKYFVTAFIGGIVSMPVIWYALHDYQRGRIMTFIDPERDPLGASYNIIQSKIAIGSGGAFGKGYLASTQSQLNFLPEYQTDFIFAFFAEEFGFFGSLMLLLLYLLLSIASLFIAINCRSTFLKMVVTGLIAIFYSHMLINILMVMGLLPVVGIPLPLISYGGTVMLSTLISFGLIMHASANYNTENF